MSLEIVSPPTQDPLHLDEVKRHLRVDWTDEDALITSLISVATAKAESFMKRALVMRQYDWRLDGFPCVLKAPFAPLDKVNSIIYTDTNGSPQTLATSVYQVDRYVEPGEIREEYNQDWPQTLDDINVVTVRYQAGYVVPFTASAPSDLLTAAGHPFVDGDVVRLQLSGGETRALPTGLSLNTNYYVRDTVAGVSFKLAATADGAAIDITGAGTGRFFAGRQVIPDPILQGLRMYLSALYENRGETQFEMPAVVAALWSPYQLEGF